MTTLNNRRYPYPDSQRVDSSASQSGRDDQPVNPGMDNNPDPITGEPGSHPVGSGIGATIGAVAGGAIGATAGPVGAAAGIVVGGFLGGAAGHSVAEAVNPSDEVEYWRVAFYTRPYSEGEHFSDYEPAYYAAAATFREYPSIRYDDAEPQLEQAWRSTSATSRVAWDKARHASRDAWERLSTKYPAGRVDAEKEAGSKLNQVLAMLHDGVAGLEQAATEVKSPQYAMGLRALASKRRQLIDALTPRVANKGTAPTDSGTITGSLRRTWMGVKSAITDDKGILSSCEQAEDALVAAYRDAMNAEELPQADRELLERQFIEVKSAHDTVRNWRDSE